MSQKRNKIIVLVGVFIMLFIIVGVIWHYRISNGYIERLVNQCERGLTNNEKGYAICPIKKNNSITILTTEEDLNSTIHPASKFILSLNLERLLHADNRYLILTEPQSFCFVFYPVPIIRSGGPGEAFEKINFFYQSFGITPFSSYKFIPKDELMPNIICTEPTTNLTNISFLVSLPNSDVFKEFESWLSYNLRIEPNTIKDLTSYGCKVLLANQSFVNNASSNIDFRINLNDNYEKMLPLLILQNSLNLAHYYK